MATNAQTIENLNRPHLMETSAAHHYQLHADVLENCRLMKLADQMREEMQEELGHSDRFVERILFLKGDPQIVFTKPPMRVASLVDMFKADLGDEEEAIDFYSKASAAAQDAGDIGSRVLFEKIALDEEQHKAWLEPQIDLIGRLGEGTHGGKRVSIPTSYEEWSVPKPSVTRSLKAFGIKAMRSMNHCSEGI